MTRHLTYLRFSLHIPNGMSLLGVIKQFQHFVSTSQCLQWIVGKSSCVVFLLAAKAIISDSNKSVRIPEPKVEVHF